MLLQRDFYAQNTHKVARGLLGKLIVRRWRGKNIAGRIVEVESYVGQNDAACHAARGKTKRNEIMFGEAGYAYVYLIYGMYHCLNIVTGGKDFPAAVLIRALEPIKEINLMSKYRKTNVLNNLTTGPGKLTQALQITRILDGEDLTLRNKLFVEDDGFKIESSEILRSPRVGVDYAGEDAKLLWRYCIRDSKFVSK
jgi:DNA-3-methyladenine glycosylase